MEKGKRGGCLMWWNRWEERRRKKKQEGDLEKRGRWKWGVVLISFSFYSSFLLLIHFLFWFILFYSHCKTKYLFFFYLIPFSFIFSKPKSYPLFFLGLVIFSPLLHLAFFS
ncbi:hypothetical protein V8C35DRAFT_290296 [Trichoderma chlorosporum]